MPSHSKRTSFSLPTSATKPAVYPDIGSLSKRPSAPAQGGSMPTGTRTIGRSTASNSVSVASVSKNSDTPFEEDSLQNQRLAMFAAQHRQEDGTPYGRLQDTMTTTTRDEGARDAFYQARAVEAIRQFDNVFNSNN